MRGRPLWFAGSVVGGWIAVRLMLLSPEVSAAEDAAKPRAAIPAGHSHTAPPSGPLPDVALIGSPRWFGHAKPTATSAHSAPTTAAVKPALTPRALTTAPRQQTIAPATAPLVPAPARANAPPGLPPTARHAERSRWSGSTWAIVRDGGAGALLSPLLGGSQTGVRIAYALDPARRVAVFARAAGPFKRGSTELALGAQWRPTPAPVTLFAEARAIRGDLAPAAGVFGGGAVGIGRFRLDGYGQAGVIARNGVSSYGDGQLRLIRPLGPIEAGISLWGASQRGASRLDVGPSIALPIAADPFALRLTVDWRHRLTGNARPASGPVLSLGADF